MKKILRTFYKEICNAFTIGMSAIMGAIVAIYYTKNTIGGIEMALSISILLFLTILVNFFIKAGMLQND